MGDSPPNHLLEGPPTVSRDRAANRVPQPVPSLGCPGGESGAPRHEQWACGQSISVPGHAPALCRSRFLGLWPIAPDGEARTQVSGSVIRRQIICPQARRPCPEIEPPTGCRSRSRQWGRGGESAHLVTSSGPTIATALLPTSAAAQTNSAWSSQMPPNLHFRPLSLAVAGPPPGAELRIFRKFLAEKS